MRISYGWIIVAAGAVMTCVAAGAMFSLAVFLQPIARDTGWSVTGISTAMSVLLIVMGLAGFGWGMAADRIGARPVLLVASLLTGLALVLASRATSLTEFLLVYGVLAGIAGGGFFAPLTSTAIAWVDSHRGLAAALVTAGFGVAPLTMSPLAVHLIEAYGWRDAMFTVGLIAWALLLPTACLLRRAPAEMVEHAVPATAAPPATGAASPVRAALGSPHFAALALTFFFCCAAHSGPIFHMVSYATLCGVGPMAAVSIYGVEGAAGLFGRLALGLAADRWGAKPVVIVGLTIQAAAIAGYTAVGDLTHFYVLATIFGTAYGGVMPLYAVLARDWFGVRILGSVLGAAGMISSVGMAFGPIGGGWLLENFGGYAWMFVGSAIVGLGAVLVAMTFPPARATPATA
jgi:MFS family permease